MEQLADLAAATGGYPSIRIQFHGEGLDRFRDRDHAALVDQLVEILRVLGWEVATEVSFNEYGERGSIDILAFHPETGALLVVEVKTVVPDVGGMLATLDRKVRLARGIAAARGWQVQTVSRLLVLPDASTARRRVEQHDATFANAFPDRTVAVRLAAVAGWGAVRAEVSVICSVGRQPTAPCTVGQGPAREATLGRRLTLTGLARDPAICSAGRQMTGIRPSVVDGLDE